MSTTLVLDPDTSWRPLEDRMQREPDPSRRALLEQVRNHMRSEIQGRFDELMETLTAEPQYHFWGGGQENGPKGQESNDLWRTSLSPCVWICGSRADSENTQEGKNGEVFRNPNFVAASGSIFATLDAVVSTDSLN
jgi:hypothetical protein